VDGSTERRARSAGSSPEHFSSRVVLFGGRCQKGTFGGLRRIGGRGGGIPAPDRGPPFQHARFRPLEPPPFGLLGSMVVPAQRSMSTYAVPSIGLASNAEDG